MSKWKCPLTGIELSFKRKSGFKVTFNKRILPLFENLNAYIKEYLKTDIVIQKCKCCDNKINVYTTFNYNFNEGIIEFVKGPKVCLSKKCKSSKFKYTSREYAELVKCVEYVPIVNGSSWEAFRKKINPETGLLYTEAEINVFFKNKSKKGQKTLRDTGWYNDKSNNAYSKEFWLKKGYSEEEAKNKISDRGKKAQQTLRKKGWHDKKSNNPYSKEFWLKKGYSEEEAQVKVNSRNCRRKEYWLKQGYGEEESIALAKREAATNTLSFIIEHYELTLLEAQDLFLQRINQRKETAKKNGYKGIKRGAFKSSHKANKLFKVLYKFLRKNGYKRKDIYFDLNKEKHEWFVNDGEKIYFYDFVVPELNLVIEFNGEHVHPNKEILTADEWKKWRHAFTKKTAPVVHEYDMYKLNLIKRKFENVLVVWSKDIKINDILEYIKKLITERNTTNGEDKNKKDECYSAREWFK